MKRERLEYLAHFIIVLVGAALIAVLVLKHIFVAVMPFLFAWLAALASERPAAYLSKRIRIPPRILRLLIAALVTVSVVAVILLFGRLVVGELWSLLSGLGEDEEFGKRLETFSEQMLGIFGRIELPSELRESIEKAFSGMAASFLSTLGSVLTDVAGAIPRILLFVAVTLIAVIYFALDLESINAAVKSILPRKVCEILSSVKSRALGMVWKYLSSYFLIMLITASVMLTGFLLLGVDYALLFAVIVAVLDLLPVIGVGTALVPASLFSFISGNRSLAIGLLILFAVNSVIRQLVEPKILGKHLGMHPLVTLAAMYIGYSFFGFVGILLLPLIVIAVGIYKNDSPKVKEGADT